MLACRACHRPLTGAEGCAICSSIKANLVTTDENVEESPALTDVSAEVVSALRVILKRHRDAMREKDADPDALEKAEKALVRVANTLAKVLEAARKLQSDGIAAVRNMSFNDRSLLFASWYQALPPLYRKKVREGMDLFEVTASAPLPQLSAGDAHEDSAQV